MFQSCKEECFKCRLANSALCAQRKLWIASCSGNESTEGNSYFTDSGLNFFHKRAVVGHERTVGKRCRLFRSYIILGAWQSIAEKKVLNSFGSRSHSSFSSIFSSKENNWGPLMKFVLTCCHATIWQSWEAVVDSLDFGKCCKVLLLSIALVKSTKMICSWHRYSKHAFWIWPSEKIM